MKNIRVAINGFGRIGRVFFRNVVKNPTIEISAINDLADINVLTHLLKYDSIYGLSDFDVSCDSDNIIVNEKKIDYPNVIRIFKNELFKKKLPVKEKKLSQGNSLPRLIKKILS